MENKSNAISVEDQKKNAFDGVRDMPPGVTDSSQIKRLVHLINHSDIAEIELKKADEGLHLVLRKLKAPVYSAQGNEAQDADTSLSILPADRDQATPAPDLHHLRAPIVGVFHPGLKPHTKALITVGDHVKAGQAVGTIEALGIFNEVEATITGRIVEIVIQNGQRVEYGQPLMTIESADG